MMAAASGGYNQGRDPGAAQSVIAQKGELKLSEMGTVHILVTPKLSTRTGTPREVRLKGV